MCDVVFITLNTKNTIKDESKGTMELATILHSKGITSEIVPFWKIGDVKKFDAFVENAMKIIQEYQPKIVSFYTRCDFYHVDLRLAQRIKELFEDIYVVFGGPQADVVSEETIKNVPYVDFVCCGEGENTIYPFFSSLLAGKPDLSIDGLVYRDGDVVKKNPRPAMVEDLDSLPIIDFSLAKYDNISNETHIGIEVGRGCPFGCVFCSTNSFWGRRYRLKSPKRIIEEVKAFHDEYGISNFTFAHDMFTFNRDKVIEVCRLLKELDFPVKWSCSARIDCIDYELIDIMVDAGMYHIYFGIESASPRMQKIINKNLKIDNVVDIIKYANDKNIEVVTSFIYGFPEETEEDISLTLSLIGKFIGFENVLIQVHLCAFLPQTPLTHKYRDLLTPTQQYSDITGNVAVEECKDIIESYPELFAQVMEYKTELRTKLRYFSLFIKIWKILSPVFSYMSESYPEDRMIDMYFDFVNDNKEFFENDKNLSMKQIAEEIVKNDKFKLRWADDENYDIIKDHYRLRQMLGISKVSNIAYDTDVLCFDPNAVKQCSSIREYKKGSYVVVCDKGKVVSFPKK